MGIILSSLFALGAVECFFRLPFLATIKTIINIANRAIHVVISKKISDYWKERVLMRYARDLFFKTIILSFMLFLCVFIVILPAIIFDRVFVLTPSIIKSMSSLFGIISMTIVSVIYVYVRKHYVK